MTKTRCFLVTALAVTVSTQSGVHGLSRNTIRTHLPETHSTPIATTGPAVAETSRRRIGSSNDSNMDMDHEMDAAWNTAASSLSSSSVQSRSQALRSISSVFLATTAGVLSSTLSPASAQAFDRSFPDELTDADETDKAAGVLIGKRSNSQQRLQQAEASKKQRDQSLASFSPKKDLLPSLTWGLALFFASGSRSNPLATPLANLLYDEKEETWLQDRNEGLFSAPPVEFLALLGVVFVVLGTLTQFLLLQLSEGDSGVCGQLAGVALINGGFFELARIASGEKQMTKDENDRAVQLEDEFEEFAEKRLKLGGNCHKSDVVKSFRRYFAKYRQADSEQYPLTDLEIERLLRSWNKQKNQGRAEMRSTGFYYGIQINTDADVFV